MKNSLIQLAYGGPMPPRGTHNYHFTMYALDTGLKVHPGLTKHELKKPWWHT
jgi:hypothetical protein